MKLQVVEGNTQRLDGGAMFGNAPKEMWKKWITPDELNRIPLATRALLLQVNNKNILFETGVGAFFEPKLRDRFGIQESDHRLLKNLEGIGLSDDDIDMIVLSHLHFDHSGGLLSDYDSGPLHLLFPNAKIYISKIHWEYAQKPHRRERASFIPQLHDLLAESGRLVLIEGENHPDLPVTFHYSNGHTRGLMAAEISMPSGPLVFISDMAPGVPWVHLPITMGYDRCSELMVDEKKNLFENLLNRGGSLFFTHDPTTPFAKIRQDEKHKFYAEPWEEGE